MPIDLTPESWHALTGLQSNMLRLHDCTAVVREMHGIAPNRVALIVEVSLARGGLRMQPYLQAIDLDDALADKLIATIIAARGHAESEGDHP